VERNSVPWLAFLVGPLFAEMRAASASVRTSKGESGRPFPNAAEPMPPGCRFATLVRK